MKARRTTNHVFAPLRHQGPTVCSFEERTPNRWSLVSARVLVGDLRQTRRSSIEPYVSIRVAYTRQHEAPRLRLRIKPVFRSHPDMTIEQPRLARSTLALTAG